MADNTAHITAAELLRAVEKLPPAELDEFVKNVISFQAFRQAKNLPQIEADLFQYVITPLPDAVLARYRKLIALRRAEHLTPIQHSELIQLGDTIEAFHLQRMTKLVELAKLRDVSLTQLMQELDIHPELYA